MLRSLPDLAYNVSKSATDVTLIYGKNLWRRAEILSEFKSRLALFDEYLVKNGERPEDIAYRIYNNGFYGWTLLIANDITNYYEQWPRSAQQLEDYVNSKYDNPAAIKHYETTEVKDANNNVIVPAGKVVPSSFSVSYYDGTSTVTATPVSSVSNYTYEANLNAKKETIQIIRPEYIEEFVAVYERILRKSGGITVGVARDSISM